MNTNEKIITLAQMYCRENYSFWIGKYQKELTGDDYPRKYTDRDYDTFPRYQTLNAIGKGVALLVGRKFKTFDICVKFILDAADFKDVYAKNLINPIGNLAIEDEKRKYREYILSISENDLENAEVKKITYERRLGKHESEKIRKSLSEKWGYCKYWHPLIDGEIPANVLFVMTKYVSTYEGSIIDIIKKISLEKYYEISEFGDDYKYSKENFNLPLYGWFGEIICCDDTFEWVVYESHEGTISFGGDKLVREIKELLKKYEVKFNLIDWMSEHEV